MYKYILSFECLKVERIFYKKKEKKILTILKILQHENRN